MNGRRIINLPKPVDPTDALRLQDLTDLETVVADGAALRGNDLSDLADKEAATNNLLFLQSGTGAVSRSVRAKLREVVTPEDFGAVGDGATDDSPEFQLAINYLSSLGGGVLHLTSGKNYFLSQQINLCDNLCIWGYGAKITVGTGFAGQERPLFKNFSGTQFTAPGTVLADSNLSFYGFEVIGGSTGIAASLIPNVDMRGVIICIGGWDAGSGADNVVVRDCNMHDFAGAGVMLWHCTNFDVSFNQFTNFFANVSLSVGAPIDTHACNGGTITGNTINHTSTGLSWHGMVLLDWTNPTENVVVSRNKITSLNGGDGISAEGNSGVGSNGRNLVISENLIFDCTGGQGIDLLNCISVKCVNNIVRRVGGPGILATGCLTLEAAGNTIEDSGLGGIMSRSGTLSAIIFDNDVSDINYTDANYAGHGIEVVDYGSSTGQTILISGNRVKDTDGCGILAFAERGKITGNLSINAGRSISNGDTLRMGIRSRLGCSVTDNDVVSTGTTQYGIGSGSGDFFSVSANRFAGTFGQNWYHIGYRQTATNLNLGINLIDLVYDASANVLSGRYNGVPAGYYFLGDTITYTQPTAGGFIGSTVVTTGTTWKTFGAVSA